MLEEIAARFLAIMIFVWIGIILYKSLLLFLDGAKHLSNYKSPKDDEDDNWGIWR